MTLARRVSALETGLSPTQLVLRWLAEAHSYGDIESYVAWCLSTEPPAAPLDRLARAAVHAAWAATRGKRPEVLASGLKSALRETVFRFELVLRINATTQQALGRPRDGQGPRGDRLRVPARHGSVRRTPGAPEG